MPLQSLRQRRRDRMLNQLIPSAGERKDWRSKVVKSQENSVNEDVKYGSACPHSSDLFDSLPCPITAKAQIQKSRGQERCAGGDQRNNSRNERAFPEQPQRRKSGHQPGRQ